MAQLEIPFQAEWIDVRNGESRACHYLEINPNGTLPFLVLDDGRTIGESNAMLWHLAAGSPLFPQSSYEEAMAIEWMIIEQTQLAQNISSARYFASIASHRRAAIADKFNQWLEHGHEGLTRLNRHLASQDFVAGDAYTIADIALYGFTHVADEGDFDMSLYPAIRRWITRVSTMPNYRPMDEILIAA
jgi:glutathione S-transferase